MPVSVIAPLNPPDQRLPYLADDSQAFAARHRIETPGELYDLDIPTRFHLLPNREPDFVTVIRAGGRRVGTAPTIPLPPGSRLIFFRCSPGALATRSAGLPLRPTLRGGSPSPFPLRPWRRPAPASSALVAVSRCWSPGRCAGRWQILPPKPRASTPNERPRSALQRRHPLATFRAHSKSVIGLAPGPGEDARFLLCEHKIGVHRAQHLSAHNFSGSSTDTILRDILPLIG